MDADLEAGESESGCYTRMLQTALNVHSLTTTSNYTKPSQLRISETVRERRLRPAGHCVHHYEETASKVLLWEP